MITASRLSLEPAESAQRRAGEIKRHWRTGEAPDAAAVIGRDRDLAAYKSVVIDLAYEEYCLREQAGERPDADDFCGRFPKYRSSIRRVLDAHRMVTERPELLAADPVEWATVGTTFEGLEIVGELGRGTFGRAYLAFDPEIDRPCVLKLSLGRSVEARVIGALRHPHVTDVYWARCDGRRTAVCMPLTGLSTLDDIREAAFSDSAPRPSADTILAAIEPVGRAGGKERSPESVVRPGESYTAGIAAVLCRIADALCYLHAKGYSHGDLKPTNVVLGRGGHPYLIDFNLSATDGGAAGPVGGTLPYMAPEQIRRWLGTEGPAVDAAKADVYAFGAMACELLTGKPPADPVPGRDPKAAAAELLDSIEKRDLTRLTLLPGVPKGLSRVIRRCLVGDPIERPDASQLVRDLESFLRVERQESRPRMIRRAVLVMSLVLIGVVGWMARPLFRPEPAGPVPAGSSTVAKAPETAEEFIARGRLYLKEEQWSLALADFLAARKQKSDPDILAVAAFCASREGNNPVAIQLGQEALKAGANSAAVFNNLGYCQFKSNKAKLALDALNRAVELDPKLFAARYNRAMTRQKLAFQTGKPFDPAVNADLDEALTCHPDSAEFYYDAAKIFAVGLAADPSVRSKVVHCLTEAVRCGMNPVRFEREPLLQSLKPDAEYLRLIKMKSGPSNNNTSPQLVEPPSF